MKIRIIMFLIIAAFLLSNPVFSMDHMEQEDEFLLKDLIEKFKSFKLRPSFELYKECIDKDILKLNKIILYKIRVDILTNGSLQAKELKNVFGLLNLSIKYNINRDTLLRILNDIGAVGMDSISNTER